jgi:hypothetical protein
MPRDATKSHTEARAKLTAAERLTVAAAFEARDAAGRLPASYQRTVAVEEAGRMVSRAKAITAAAACRLGSRAENSG